ncbi:polymorphic toxin-type HINT domain-containing protein [Cellulomonas iranensis]|uniref:polymorphic toxin-type HINT domain-containing protein n=1 Tax=Cellulomonas iranensis TaxID=76862 RepID=UPI003D7C67D5
MSDGSLTPIEDLQVGDMVLAGDPETGQTSAEAVITPLTSTGDKHLVALRFDGDVEAVVATDNHPYWVRDAGWVAAGELVVGDTTLASDGAVRTLVQTTDLGWFQDQTVHNLHVAGEHTYYVTADPAQADQLVHNAASCPVGSSGTIVNDRGVRVTIRTRDHGPAHAHVEGRGPKTKIGQNGKPIARSPELSAHQRQVVGDNIKAIRKAVKRYMRAYRRLG